MALATRPVVLRRLRLGARSARVSQQLGGRVEAVGSLCGPYRRVEPTHSSTTQAPTDPARPGTPPGRPGTDARRRRRSTARGGSPCRSASAERGPSGRRRRDRAPLEARRGGIRAGGRRIRGRRPSAPSRMASGSRATQRGGTDGLSDAPRRGRRGHHASSANASEIRAFGELTATAPPRKDRRRARIRPPGLDPRRGGRRLRLAHRLLHRDLPGLQARGDHDLRAVRQPGRHLPAVRLQPRPDRAALGVRVALPPGRLADLRPARRLVAPQPRAARALHEAQVQPRRLGDPHRGGRRPAAPELGRLARADARRLAAARGGSRRTSSSTTRTRTSSGAPST